MYKVAISGASSGIGRSLALESLSRGYNVALMDLDASGLLDIQNDFGTERCIIFEGDTSNHDHVNQFSQSIISAGGYLKFAFANAGILRSGSIADSPIETFDTLFKVNTLGSLIFARNLLPQLEKCPSSAHMIFTSSSSMLRSSANFGGYSASKHAMLAIAEALDMELKIKDSNVLVTVLCPSAVKTAIAQGDSQEILKLQDRIAERGIAPSDLARLAFDQILAGKSCVFTDSRTPLTGLDRMEALTRGHFVHRE